MGAIIALDKRLDKWYSLVMKNKIIALGIIIFAIIPAIGIIFGNGENDKIFSGMITVGIVIFNPLAAISLLRK